MKKYRKVILKIIISTLLLSLIFIKLDKASFVETIKLLNFAYAPLIILFLIGNYVVSSIRWKALIIHGNSEKVSIRYLTYLYFTGAFFNNFMPTSIGGDVYKVFKLGKKLNNTVDAFSATFMERFTGVIALMLISVVSMVQLLGMWGIILFVGFFIGLYVGFLLLSFLSHKSVRIAKIYNSLNTYRGKYKVLTFAFVTSFIVQFLSIFTQYFVFLALGKSLPLVYSFFVFPMINLAGFFIPSINGIGVQDYLYINLFSIKGVPEALGFSASVVFHLFRLGVSLIGGVLYALGKDD